MNELIFQKSPIVTIATNTFINVPNVIKFEDTNLIEVINELNVGYTTQIPIYHSDGTYIAKVIGNRIFLTKEGKNANLKINKFNNIWECTLDNRTLFEIHTQSGDSFKAVAELYAPEGYFVKFSDSPSPGLIDMHGNSLKIGGMVMSGCRIVGCKTGIWIGKDGSLAIGSNK